MDHPAENLNIPARPGADDDPAFGAQGWLRGLRILSTVHFRDSAPLRPKPTVVPGWLLEILVDGRVDMSSDGVRWHTLEPGTGILCAPRAVHFERTSAVGRRMPYRSVYAIFTDETGRLHEWLDATRQFWWVKDDERRLETTLGAMADLGSDTPSGTLAAAGALLNTLSLLLSAPTRGDDIEIQRDREEIPEMIRGAHRFLRMNLGRPVRLADIAAHIGSSESALSHTYRRLTGRTPMQTLRGLRVEAARHHLLRGRLKLEAIADATGFADAAHLSRAFKGAFGLSPRSYRQQMLKP